MYCKNCGKVINNSSQFCASCGTATRVPVTTVACPNPIKPQSSNVAGETPQKKRIVDSLMVIVAVILILMGAGYMGLTLAGTTVTAQVMDYEQVLFLNNDSSTRNPSRYKLEYQFSANGKQYDGAVTRVFQSGSHMKNAIKIRYLPIWPHVNAEDGTEMVLAGPAATGLGVFILLVTFKKKKH